MAAEMLGGPLACSIQDCQYHSDIIRAEQTHFVTFTYLTW